MLPKYQEVSDKKLGEMNAEEKLTEIKKAFNEILKKTIPPEPEDLIDGMYKRLEPPFNKGTIKRLEFNHYLYICFADVVQRLI
jgi:hypothetical protein